MDERPAIEAINAYSCALACASYCFPEKPEFSQTGLLDSFTKMGYFPAWKHKPGALTRFDLALLMQAVAPTISKFLSTPDFYEAAGFAQRKQNRVIGFFCFLREPSNHVWLIVDQRHSLPLDTQSANPQTELRVMKPDVGNAKLEWVNLIKVTESFRGDFVVIAETVSSDSANVPMEIRPE